MKVRKSFVSNSSSSSYIIALDDFPNVFTLTKNLLEHINHDEITAQLFHKGQNHYYLYDTVKYYAYVLEVEHRGLDPNRPLKLPGNVGFSISKYEACYYIFADWEYELWNYYQIAPEEKFDEVSYLGNEFLDFNPSPTASLHALLGRQKDTIPSPEEQTINSRRNAFLKNLREHLLEKNHYVSISEVVAATDRGLFTIRNEAGNYIHIPTSLVLNEIEGECGIKKSLKIAKLPPTEKIELQPKKG